MLQSLCDMKQQMEDYMLDDRNIVFSSSMVFYERNTEKIRFCYIPGYTQVETAGIRGLLEEVLQHLDHRDSQAVRIGYEMYECCVQSDFLVSDCRRCLRSSDPEEDLSVQMEEPDRGLLEDTEEEMAEKREKKEAGSSEKNGKSGEEKNGKKRDMKQITEIFWR